MVVKNYDLSVIESGRMMAHTIIDLLSNNAKNAKKKLKISLILALIEKVTYLF